MGWKARLIVAALGGVAASILFYPLMDWLGITLDPRSPIPLFNGVGVFILILILPLLARRT